MASDLPSVRPAPCGECPWRRASIPGWLGPFSAQEWRDMAHGEVAIACHTTIDGEETNNDGEADWDQPGLLQCAGAAIYRSNVCKSPRDPHVATLPRDTDLVFGMGEFIPHHDRDS